MTDQPTTGPQPEAEKPLPEPGLSGTPLGLGFCMPCITAWKVAVEAGRTEGLPVVTWAVTSVPSLIQVPGPLGGSTTVAVAVPACYQHIPTGPARGGLLVPNGGL